MLGGRDAQVQVLNNISNKGLDRFTSEYDLNATEAPDAILPSHKLQIEEIDHASLLAIVVLALV